MKKNTTIVLCGAAFAFLPLVGCNTTEGIGEDISKAGTAITRAASETGSKIAGNDKSTKKTEVTHEVDGAKKTTVTTTSTKTTSSN